MGGGRLLQLCRALFETLLGLVQAIDRVFSLRCSLGFRCILVSGLLELSFFLLCSVLSGAFHLLGGVGNLVLCQIGNLFGLLCQLLASGWIVESLLVPCASSQLVGDLIHSGFHALLIAICLIERIG